ncbi:MAG: hypothetical protein HWN66_08545 [Candidatus Helarchaeota archaeon]|nr:hypothetical protein [Candidatus Helarchaeota archaeon]
MENTISKLLNQKTLLISAVSEKFHISLDGAKEFLKLVILDWIKTSYNIQISENTLKDHPDLVQKLEKDILNWTIDDSDDDNFQVIGYCKNLR